MSGAGTHNMPEIMLPENIRKLEQGERFRFRCHPGVPCFNECCRQLDLTLTPFDALRLSEHLGLTSSVFFDRYAVVEQEEGDIFPQVFLAMVDDGRASCPFVRTDGCSVYASRPGACRTYPLGRGAFQTPDGNNHEIHVLLSEPHCQGFQEAEEQNVDEWNQDQELLNYNAMNDEILTLLQHQRIKNGIRLSQAQCADFILALYQLDLFREKLLAGSLTSLPPMSAEEREEIATDNLHLLRFGIKWLHHVLFRD